MTSHETLSLLLQPALIRLIDQLRLQLKAAEWTWSYDTVEVWPDQVPETTRSRYEEMMRALDVASGDDAEAIQDVLDELPQPIPLYRLEITDQSSVPTINMWQLCYQICLKDYTPQLQDMSLMAPDLNQNDIDSRLTDQDGEIDWDCLNQNAQLVVEKLIASIVAGEVQ
ncbi:MAG: hypothetical protein AAGB01_02690 [Cyanobacteria bacterium P01_F01_bin.42]